MHVLLRYVDKGGEALAEPHGDLSVHVDGEGLKALLETTHGVVLKSAGVLAQVHTSNLRHSQTAHRNETCEIKGFGAKLLGLSVQYLDKISCSHVVS